MKYPKVNEASSLMLRGSRGNSQMYRVPSFDPFDNDDEVCQRIDLEE